MARSLLNLNMQDDTVSASLGQIQSFPDTPDFAHKSMGQHFKSKTHTYLTGGGYFFVHEGIYIAKRTWANLIKIPATFKILYNRKYSHAGKFREFREYSKMLPKLCI